LGPKTPQPPWVTLRPSNNDVVYYATFSARTSSSDTGEVEAGIFNTLSNGTILCRKVFSVINKAPSDSLSNQWTISASK